MGYIGSSHNPAIAGEVTVNPAEFTAEAAATTSGERDTDFVIPAGQFYVKIKNVSPKGGGAMVNATRNGDDLAPGQTWEFNKQTDNVNAKDITSPELTIVTNGAMIWYEYF